MANKLPFLQGTRPIWKAIASIPITPGLQAADVKIPKNGWLGKLRFQHSGTATVTGAGSAGSPLLQNIIGSYVLSLGGNYQYRNIDGESLMIKAEIEFAGNGDPVLNGPNYTTYNPASATAQPYFYDVWDTIALNDGLNADECLLAAQARNYDLILSLFFNPVSSVVANTEVVTLTGTLTVYGWYFLDADYNTFQAPDDSYVQQVIDDKSYTAVAVGDNVIPVVPINGPEYWGIAFQPIYNNVVDTRGPTSATTRVRLRVNNGQDIMDLSAQALADENYKMFGRNLPRGYYYIDFLSDTSIVNAVSPYRTRSLSTVTLNQLELIVTVAAGTTVSNSRIKLIKRLRNPAVS